MIAEHLYLQALFALNGVIVKARAIAYENGPTKSIAELLDYAEQLPRLIASDADETEVFHQIIKEISERYGARFILDRFESGMPDRW